MPASPSPARLPAGLQEIVDLLNSLPDRRDRIQALIDLGERFEAVPPRVATRPFPRAHRTPACESEAYVFAEPLGDGTMKFHFAVENPQGISARATAVILDRGLSGAPLEQVLAVPQDFILEVFGQELSMGKSMGLMGMVSMVHHLADRARQGLSLTPDAPPSPPA